MAIQNNLLILKKSDNSFLILNHKKLSINPISCNNNKLCTCVITF